MRTKTFLFLGLCFGAVLTVHARVTVSAELSAKKYLLYEPIRLRLTVANESNQALKLGGDEANSRLFFQVSDVENQVIPSMGVPVFQKPWRIAPGATVSRDFNLVRLFKLRSTGDYRLVTRIHLPDETLVDKARLFEINNGLPVKEIKSRPRDRAFSLIGLNRDDQDELLLRISDYQGTRIFQTYFLGKHLRFYPPEFREGRDGSIAILHRLEPGKLSFARFKADGSPIDRRTLNIKPNENVRLEEDDESGFVVRGVAGAPLEAFEGREED